MPLRLKSLELHGYKTFAAKTNFEFAEGITAIVGPNGSGKSNIADSLRWVLGEQSYSLLRAKKTEDMIFAGSEQRPRAGMASAGVTFDNSDGWLPVDFSEVALARRSYRDGRNEYLLNSQHVRLKDINELLAQSGLSERTYTILGQGLVDASLALKADERRRLFEEAAGIGLYRTRREEALRRLETTKRNLDRVLDILAELEPRLKSLERQAARAQEYTRVQADLRVLLLEWYGFHWHRAQGDLSAAMELGRNQEAKLGEARDSYQKVRQNFTAFRDHLNGLRARLNSWHRQSAQLHESRESTSGNLAVLDERERTLLDNRQMGMSEQSRYSEEIKVARERLAETETETVRLQTELDDAVTQAKSAQAALDKLQVEKSSLQAGLQTIQQKVQNSSTQRAGLLARLEELASRSEGQKQKLETLVQAIASADVEVGKTARDLQDVLAARQKAESALHKAEAELQLVRNQQTDLESRMKEKQSAHAARQAEQARFKAQLDVLDQAEHSLAGYADGAKILLDASRQSKLSGVNGALSAALDVPAELEVAIAAALGEYTDAVLMVSGQVAEQAITLLDSNQSGRASLLPLDWLSPDEPLKMKRSVDCLGVASELVKAAVEYRPALDLLLGQVLIVRNRAAARRVLAGQPKYARAVTVLGEVFHASGQVTAGKPVKAAALGRPRQRRELQERLANVGNQVTVLESEMKKLSDNIETIRGDMADCQETVSQQRAGLESARNSERQAQLREESARRQWNWQVSQKTSIEVEIEQAGKELEQSAAALTINEKETLQVQEALRNQTASLATLSTGELQEQVTFWSTGSAVAERALRDARTRQIDRKSAAERVQMQQTALEKRLTEIDEALVELENARQNLRTQTAGINFQLEELRSLIEPAEKELETSEAHEMELQKLETEGQSGLARVERTYNQIQLDLGRKQEMLENLRQKIEDDFGLVAFEYATDVSGPVPLPLDGMVEQLPAVKELSPDLEENMNRLRAQMRRMGAINPEAQQ